MNQPNYTMLMNHIADIADVRSTRGRRYDWTFLLTILCAALLCGNKSVRSMAQWAYNHRHEILDMLQPERRFVPSALTLYRTLRDIDVNELEERLSANSNAVDADDKVTGTVNSSKEGQLRGQSVDGKEVRGAGKQGAPLTLVSLVRYESAAVLAQLAVAQKTNEITVVPELLADRDLTGTVTTMDALLAQHSRPLSLLRRFCSSFIAHHWCFGNLTQP